MIIVPLFRGTQPRISPKLLDSTNSQTAMNCNLKRGILSPLMDLQGQAPNPIPKAGNLRSIYKLRSGDWLYWPHVVDICEAAATDSNSRIHFTGDAYPKQTDAAMATSGSVSTYPTKTRRLGLPKPDQPLTVQLAPASVDEDAEIERSTSYVYTYVTDWDEESEPSDPTGSIDVKTAQECVLTNFRLPTLDGVTVKSFRIYRLNAGDDSAESQLVPYSNETADMPSSADTFTDNVADSDLSGEVLPTENWNRPKDDVSGLIHTGNGMFFCFRGKDIYVSESFVAYAFPWNLALNVPHDVVALGYFDQTVVVLTKGHAHLINGVDPESLSIDKLSYNEACVSKRSVVNSPAGVIYASPDGLVLIGPNGMSMLTSSLYTKEQWRDLNPEKLIGFYQDGQYIAFFEGTGTGIIFDFEMQDIVNVSLTGKQVYGGHVDTEDDALYLLTYDTTYRIEKWEGSSSTLSFVWKSKDFFSSRPVNMGAARIMGEQSEASPVQFKTYLDGELVDSCVITDDEPFRLSAGMKGRDWEFQLEGTAEVFEVRMAPGIAELQYGN
ncbi:hypothetical protein [Maridesulfovibrio bastinii]|uniref:hypothetical protein n=1 Tax=Maridesulfovibrio bastinii TaxID=47157 RepID=UPI000400E6CB|nr:hypothetical protein [Maridesulfovibrio bastinii]